VVNVSNHEHRVAVRQAHDRPFDEHILSKVEGLRPDGDPADLIAIPADTT